MAESENTFVTFDRWLSLLKEALPHLGNAKNLAFAASCCERAVPNYEAFSSEQAWGDSKIVREALELVWRLVVTANPREFQSYVGVLARNLEMVTPDTEDFKSVLTSAALDAATSLSELLQYALDGECGHVLTVSSLARDTVDHFIQCQFRSDRADKEVEDEIQNHPLMAEELLKQQLDIRALQTHELSAEFVHRFRQNATKEGKSNLGICSQSAG